MLKQNLQKYFNFSQFRPGQEEIVQKILEGKDVVALMPTGGGKSLCYQLPAVISDGISIIISPLIALMKDQVDSLNARGITASFINSTLDSNEIDERMRDIFEGKIKILYIAPERFSSYQFRDFFANLNVGLFAVDEAHCVSEWGHDFRPDYLAIKKYIKLLKKRPVVAAFTATATPEVKDDIIKRLELEDPEVFIRGFDRPNLKFFAQSNLKPGEKYAEILRIIKNISGSGIVYALTRKDAEFIAQFLCQNKIKAAAYHAGMEGNKRGKIQNEFMENKFKVIVATVAFGMGVDKADIRFVIHSGMPGSLEGYYQEAGRAGRDGEMAYCMLLHGKKDVNTHKFFIRQSQSEMFAQGKKWEEIKKVINNKYDRLEKMIEYSTKPSCRRKMILKYFDDPDYKKHRENCQGCDVCLNWKKSEENIKKSRSFMEGSRSFLSATVQATVDVYKRGFDIIDIAKMRSLGVGTITEHLIDWYSRGGKFRIEEHIDAGDEEKIISAIKKVGSSERVGPIKNILPEDVSYEKIRLVIAKMKRNKVD
ncbi:MAG: RecQ family ATP-dependent DNA helicase [Parcubacteria group bacterium]|jgi:ATP-dependent DNA helicase RecQ